MGTFVDLSSNTFKNLSNVPQSLIASNTSLKIVTSINVTNRGAAPIRFNLTKLRTQGITNKICYVCSVNNLVDVTYNNGSLGIGATLTNTSLTLTAFTIDGINPAINSRILIKDQTSSFQNGIYSLTTVGSDSIPWVLTRVSDYNKPSQINVGDLISITNGTTNSNTIWKQTGIVTIIGTSPITFIENVSLKIFLINELEIKPYANINVICSTGVLQLEYSTNPFITDDLVCFSNGYTQVFDCDVNFTSFNELN